MVRQEERVAATNHKNWDTKPDQQYTVLNPNLVVKSIMTFYHQSNLLAAALHSEDGGGVPCDAPGGRDQVEFDLPDAHTVAIHCNGALHIFLMWRFRTIDLKPSLLRVSEGLQWQDRLSVLTVCRFQLMDHLVMKLIR